MRLESRRALAPLVPNAIGRLPYFLSLQVLRVWAALSGGAFEVWARNSYVLGNLVPLVSDLDVTLWLNQTHQGRCFPRRARVLARFRRIFPWIGEVNVFRSGEARALKEFANPFEMARDPALSARLGFDVPRGDIDASVFLIRMLDADLAQVRWHPASRLPKWRRHLRETGFEGEITSTGLFKAILDHATRFLPSVSHQRARSDLGSYFLSRLSGSPQKRDETGYWSRFYFPHRYCFDADAFRPEVNDEVAPKIMHRQIAWEIWGLNSQYHWIADRSGLLAHLDRMQAILRHSPEPRLTAGLELLKSFVRGSGI